MTANLPTQRQIMTGHIPAAFQNARMDPAFAQSTVNPADISAGIGAAFSVVSIRGKVFRIKYRGDEYPVVVPGTQHPAPNIDVVIVKASQAISKIWYESQFVEGNREAPDCFSTNGVSPDPSSPKKQHDFCATCPQNIWGSKSVNGKALKACQDTKRIAVVPLGDLKNEAFGGPMLLRVPPASLQDLSHYADLMVQWGQTYFSVGTQITFDIDVAHPQLVFTPMMPLTGDQARTIVELQDHPQVKRMLTEAVEYAKAEDALQPQQPVAPPPMQTTAAPPPPPPPAPNVGTSAQVPTPTPGNMPAYVPPAVSTAPTAGVVPTGQQDDLKIPAFLQRQPEPAVVPGVSVAPPPPPPPAEEPYSYTPDGLYRWRSGMAQWEPVPAQPSLTIAAPSPVEANKVYQAQPMAVATIAQPTPPANGQALTADQQRIAELEAQLAAKTSRSRKKATPPPSPAPTAVEPGTAVATTPPPVPTSLAAPPVTGGFSVSSPSGQVPATAPAPVTMPATGGAPSADVNARLDGLINTILPGTKQ